MCTSQRATRIPGFRVQTARGMGAAGDHPPASQPRRAAEVVDHRLEKGPFPQGVGPDPVRPAPSLLCPWELQCLALNHRSQTAQPRAVLNLHRIEPAAAFPFQLKMQPLASPGPACCRWRLLRLRSSTACWDPCIKVGSCQPCTSCRTHAAPLPGEPGSDTSVLRGAMWYLAESRWHQILSGEVWPAETTAPSMQCFSALAAGNMMEEHDGNQ